MIRPAISLAVNDDDEARDLSAAAGGDQQALARLYDRHAAVVLSLCRHHAASLADADDACQETFIRAFRMLDTIDHSNPIALRPWFYAIARRVCSERRRAAVRRSRHEREAAMRQAAVVDYSLTPTRLEGQSNLDRCAAAEQLDRLSIALDQLDDRERLAIHLHYLDADPLRAAESALGLSRSGYYKLLGRAREKLAIFMRQVQPS
jgi:RNA polymerase sigma-70 factor (ECF subfamily)